MEKLSEKYSKSPFKVPENYFEEVNKKIIAAATNKSEAKKVNFYGRIKPYLAIAAFISGIMLLTYTALTLLRSDELDNTIPEISLQEFSESYLNDIDINTLEESEAILLTEGYREISSPEIIDYLLLENIDVNEIYELF